MIELNQIYRQKNNKNKASWQLNVRYKVVRITEQKIYIETVNDDDNYVSKYDMTYKNFEKYLELVQ
jgi:hypothetical protein